MIFEKTETETLLFHKTMKVSSENQDFVLPESLYSESVNKSATQVFSLFSIQPIIQLNDKHG